MIVDESNIPIQKILEPFFVEKGVELFVKREDLLHPEVSGNKWRKLKYNILDAKEKGFNKIFTFGGAYSNHIAATAAAGKMHGLKTHGFIRGDELAVDNSTLRAALAHGMDFTFVSREQYKKRNNLTLFLEGTGIAEDDGFFIPEGGGNALGVLGCSEIVEDLSDFDLIVCACGTGSTLAGIVNGLGVNQKALGFPVLKNAAFLLNEVESFLLNPTMKKGKWELNLDFHFGGYAKKNDQLIDFIQDFWKNHHLKLDPIYTGKAMCGLYEFIKNKNSKVKLKIAFIHTGGLQGVEGFEQRYGLELFRKA